MKYKTYEELKEELGDKYDKYMYDINLELMKKIDKAIEYINYYKITHNIDGDIAHLDEFHILASPKLLLEILGGDKE